MYLNRNRFQYDDWFCLVIFPSRSLEPSDQKTHRIYLNSNQVQRIYLDELGHPNQQPIGINLMQLTIASDETMAEQAKQLIERVQLEETDTLPKTEILDIARREKSYEVERPNWIGKPTSPKEQQFGSHVKELLTPIVKEQKLTPVTP